MLLSVQSYWLGIYHLQDLVFQGRRCTLRVNHNIHNSCAISSIHNICTVQRGQHSLTFRDSLLMSLEPSGLLRTYRISISAVQDGDDGKKDVHVRHGSTPRARRSGETKAKAQADDILPYNRSKASIEKAKHNGVDKRPEPVGDASTLPETGSPFHGRCAAGVFSIAYQDDRRCMKGRWRGRPARQRVDSHGMPCSAEQPVPRLTFSPSLP